MARDLALYGLPPDAFDRPDEESPSEGVWPQNAEATRAFLAVDTQWRVVARAEGRVHFPGLDYDGVKAGFNLAGIALTPGLWSDVQLIEAGAVAALNRPQT